MEKRKRLTIGRPRRQERKGSNNKCKEKVRKQVKKNNKFIKGRHKIEGRKGGKKLLNDLRSLRGKHRDCYANVKEKPNRAKSIGIFFRRTMWLKKIFLTINYEVRKE